MLNFLRSLLSSRPDDRGRPTTGESPREPLEHISIPGVEPLAFASSLRYVNELPVPDWEVVSSWVKTIPKQDNQAMAWAACEVAWLQHLRVALGPTYHLAEHDGALLLSSVEHNVARAALGFMVKTLDRIRRLLDGLAQAPEWGKDILIVFDDQDTYYRYVSRYYREDGEFAGSSGMHINAGCSHFVTMKADLRSVEPVIAHEMTHGCLSHLPIPAWLNEGIAVNTEQRLCPPPPSLFSPQEMHEKHLRFWGEVEIQEFWSGKSFLRNDDGNMLSYDLARILVAQFSSTWATFRAFVRDANMSDAGASAAREHLGHDLGAAAAAILEHDLDGRWEPNPDKWNEAPEKGAFRENASRSRTQRHPLNDAVGLRDPLEDLE